ncbi:MAG: Xaa-Pro peptidase family protein [Vicinamibacterales bacterium]
MRLAPRDTLAARHARLREAVLASELDGLIVTHLPNVFYLTNFLGTAGIALVMRDRLYLILDFRYAFAAKELWDTPYGCPDAEIITVDRTYDETLLALIKRLQPKRLGIEGSNVSVNRANQLTRGIGTATELVPTDSMVERLRIIKDAHEIDMLRRGARMLSPVAVDIIGDAKPGITEQEFAAKIDWRIKSAGFERCSFETIVASGPNSARPHAHPGDRTLQEGDLVVLDFGGVYGGYCVDLTRTVALGQPDAEMVRVYHAVLDAQRAAIAAVRPGVRAGDIDAAARGTLARHGLAEAFGHSTGHGLGVEIHETPRIGPRREAAGDAPAPPDEGIEPGMVFTIEPGAYLPGWGGVRIEDDVLVTSDGVEVLTNVPTSLTQTHGF